MTGLWMYDERRCKSKLIRYFYPNSIQLMPFKINLSLIHNSKTNFFELKAYHN